MNSFLSSIAYCIFSPLLLMATLCHGQSKEAESAVESVVEAFSTSTIVSSSFISGTIHEVPLGILQRNSGVAEPEESRRIAGDLAKVLYEIPREFSGEDVHRFYRTRLQNKSFHPLFSCSGRACGSSNDWANDIFSNRILYGPAQNQYYMVYQLSEEDELSPYISIYIITRGNRRLYAYVEMIRPDRVLFGDNETSTGSFAESILQFGFSSLSAVQFRDDKLVERAQLNELINVLDENPELEIYVVSHLQGEGGLATLQDRSQKRADSIVARLIESGIAPGRLSAHGLGPLAPGCASRVCRSRIEIVRR